MVDRESFLFRLEQVAVQEGPRAAVIAEGRSLTYASLWITASQVARHLTSCGVRPGDRVGLLGIKTTHDFEHLLGIWLAGAAYVPLNHKFPAARNRAILAAAGARALLAGPHSIEVASETEFHSVASLPGGSSLWMLQGDSQHEANAPRDLAYLIFTSGTTGAPKGVPITFGNLEAFLTNLQSSYPATPEDRMSQLADLSFDASVQEYAWCWWVGATLCPVPASAALMWPRYARELETTVMLLVPSSVTLASRARMLGANSLPRLRLGFLGAEAVTKDTVRIMRETAANARLVNLWGPTESTVFFTHFDIRPDLELTDVVPIGHPFPGQSIEIWGDDGEPVPEGQSGELMQSGSQVTDGYWQSPDANRQRFALRDGRRWYRSGDLAVFDPVVGYRYLGRVDRQVKVRGHRIELQECESAVREIADCAQAAVIPVIRDGEVSADALACFVVDPKIDVGPLAAALKQRLPSYMVPASFVILDEMPLGVTGKTDYQALQAMIRTSA